MAIDSLVEEVTPRTSSGCMFLSAAGWDKLNPSTLIFAFNATMSDAAKDITFILDLYYDTICVRKATGNLY
jgi:hypothetical protein